MTFVLYSVRQAQVSRTLHTVLVGSAAFHRIMTLQFLVSTLRNAAIGVAAWVIAFQQLRLNRTLSGEQLRLSDARLRFDLYERRLVLFRG